MPIRYISKGKGKKRKVIPIRQTKGVTIRSVSLKPTAIQKVNKEQGKLLNRGETANFSKALNSVIMRAKRDSEVRDYLESRGILSPNQPIQKHHRDYFAKQFTREDEPKPILETELYDILQDVTQDETPDGEIDFNKLRKVVRENIQEILEREKVWFDGYDVKIQEVGTIRNDTEDEGGYYQFDYQIFANRNAIPRSGTVYGNISAGDVVDMNLELYNEVSWQ